jgi:hypothetical protein
MFAVTRRPATSSRTDASASRRWTGPWTQRTLCTFSSGTQVVFLDTRPPEETTQRSLPDQAWKW